MNNGNTINGGSMDSEVIVEEKTSSSSSAEPPTKQPDHDTIKMFVGQVPRSLDEKQLTDMFEAYGPVYQLNVLRDKSTGQSRGCCFVTYYHRKDAVAAQCALHDVVTMSGMHHPLQMKPADTENRNDRKLFVGMLSKVMSEKDVQAIFSPFGTLEDCAILRDSQGSSRGCAFVTFASRQCALNAIKSLHQSQTMEGCSAPLVVKLADTQKDKDLKKGGPTGVTTPTSSSSAAQSMLASLGAGLSYSTIAQQASIVNHPLLSNLVQNASLSRLTSQQQLTLLALLQQPNSSNNLLGLSNLLFNTTTASGQGLNPLNFAALSGLSSAQMPDFGGTTFTTAGLGGINSLHMANFLGAKNSSLNSLSCFLQQPRAPSPPSMGVVPITSGTAASSSYLMGSLAAAASGGLLGAAGNYGQLSCSHLVDNGTLNGASASDVSLWQNLSKISQYAGLSSLPTNSCAAVGNSPAGKQIEGPDGCNLFIYHLPQEFTDVDLVQSFQPFGTILSAKVFVDKMTNLSKCFGFVSYDNVISSQAAIQAMNGFQIGSKRLKVQLKRSKQDNKPYSHNNVTVISSN